ncbi:MAG: peptidoglycan DD-metalloendopeptidase family protein [Bacillota bacterium]|nr:peptidoglycan DD-metalloendopeptidase family protein [Bacillota bacterium]
MKTKNRRNKNKSPMTILVISETSSKPKDFKLTRKTISTVLISMCVFLMCVGVITLEYLNGRSEVSRVEQIVKENHDKKDTIEKLNAEINQIMIQQDGIVAKQQELKKLMGLEVDTNSPSQPSRGGQGGDDRIITQSNEDTEATITRIKKKLDQEEKEIDDLIASVREDQKYFLALPNQWPNDGNVSSEYGMRNSPFNRRTTSFHDGIDIANQNGTDILAAGDGVVTFSGWIPVYGKTVLIDHGYGLVSKYGHNSSLLVSEGDTVEKGEVIAKMGSTGLSTGPHLHFTIMKNGQTQDPRIYLP